MVGGGGVLLEVYDSGCLCTFRDVGECGYVFCSW